MLLTDEFKKAFAWHTYLINDGAGVGNIELLKEEERNGARMPDSNRML